MHFVDKFYIGCQQITRRFPDKDSPKIFRQQLTMKIHHVLMTYDIFRGNSATWPHLFIFIWLNFSYSSATRELIIAIPK